MDVLLPNDAAATETGLVSLDGRPYPLESAEVAAHAEGGLALTTFRQRYRNPYEEALEVVYVLPLPADGAVLGYEVRVGERRITGEIQSREAAAAAYHEALYQGRTAGLLEQERDDTFHQRLGNVPRGRDVEVEIRVLHPLAFREGGASAEWEYRFPTTVGVRYMGSPGRVEDAERLSPGRAREGLPTRLALDLRIVDPVGADAVRSPSHALRSTHAHEVREGSRVTFRDDPRLDRDVVIRWPALEDQAAVRLTEGAGNAGDGGRYALVTALPPAAVAGAHRRDLTLLVDASGSMHGVPLELAKRVVRGVLEGLEGGDRFEILAFSNRAHALTDGMVRAEGPALADARRKLDALGAGGGTEMLGALDTALRTLRDDAQRQVLLLTDGYIGFEQEVVTRAARGLPEGVRIHVVGLGAAPNRTLTRGLARAGRGSELFASDEGTAAETADALRRATARPVLTELELRGSALRNAAPARPPDVMAGRPALLTLELAPEGGRLELRARVAGRARPWRWTARVPMARPDDAPLPIGALHGRQLVDDLELEAAGGAGRRAVDAEIERTALRHRIVSRRTSLVAIAEEPSVDPRSPRRKERLAVELPAGVSAEGTGLGGGGIDALMSRLSVADRGTTRRMPGGLASGFVAEEAYSLDAPAPSDPSSDADLSDFSIEPPARPSRSRDTPYVRVPIAEVLHRGDDLLVVELEVPFDELRLPTGAVLVVLDDGRELAAEVDEDASTPAGPHPAGVRVRLALRATGGIGWPRIERATVCWPTGGGAFA